MKATSDDTIPVINARASLSKFFQRNSQRRNDPYQALDKWPHY